MSRPIRDVECNQSPEVLARMIVCDGSQQEAIEHVAGFIEGFDNLSEEIKVLRAELAKMDEALRKIDTLITDIEPEKTITYRDLRDLYDTVVVEIQDIARAALSPQADKENPNA